jgi:hypothetical protein
MYHPLKATVHKYTLSLNYYNKEIYIWIIWALKGILLQGELKIIVFPLQVTSVKKIRKVS